MTRTQFRKLALALEGVEEAPHMDRTAFRTKRKIFATMGADDRVNLMIHPAEKRDGLIDSFPDAFFSLGGWTRLGYVAVDLRKVDPGLLRELVGEAWHDALPRKKTGRAK
jgi:hypothetical protein